jgi:sulfofructose kinase
MESLEGSGINIDDVQVRNGAANQSAYIIIDQTTGERTVLWRRPEELKLNPAEVRPEMITSSRMLHIDGHDTPAVARAASIARSHSIPVTVDVDTVYHGFDEVLPFVDYLITSSEFPAAWTNRRDPLEALAAIQDEYGMRLAAMTLGSHGCLARTQGRFFYSPAFVVNCVDTTGAGDIFHGAFCYAMLEDMPLHQALDFSNAMAALNCTRLGARGGIASRAEAEQLMREGHRRVQHEIAARAAR